MRVAIFERTTPTVEPVVRSVRAENVVRMVGVLAPMACRTVMEHVSILNQA